MKRLTVRTSRRHEIVDITPDVRSAVGELGVTSGVVVVYVPHTTAGVCVNENYDPDVKHDVIEKLRRLFPQGEPFFRHGEGNSDSHLLSILTGTSAVLIVEDSELRLGQWQGVWFCEYDGPRTREVWVGRA